MREIRLQTTYAEYDLFSAMFLQANALPRSPATGCFPFCRPAVRFALYTWNAGLPDRKRRISEHFHFENALTPHTLRRAAKRRGFRKKALFSRMILIEIR